MSSEVRNKSLEIAEIFHERVLQEFNSNSNMHRRSTVLQSDIVCSKCCSYNSLIVEFWITYDIVTDKADCSIGYHCHLCRFNLRFRYRIDLDDIRGFFSYGILNRIKDIFDDVIEWKEFD